MTISPLIAHVETYLGVLKSGWKNSRDNVQMPFQVIQTTEGAISGICCYSTIGLSHFDLASSTSEKIIHQELFIAVNDTFNPRNIPSILQGVGQQRLQFNTALLRGQVIGPREGVVIADTIFSALYVAMPAYWPDQFATCKVDARSIVFAWLVPITATEAKFIDVHGWSAFEDTLCDTHIDMCDLCRGEMTFK